MAMANNEIVNLNDSLTQLQREEKMLMAEYELAYDLNAIEHELISSGRMVKASAAETVFLDMSEGDNVVYYEAAQDGVPAWSVRWRSLSPA
jgi:hypothetical protein